MLRMSVTGITTGRSPAQYDLWLSAEAQGTCWQLRKITSFGGKHLVIKGSETSDSETSEGLYIYIYNKDPY